MVFKEPIVEMIELLPNDINTTTGPGYTICQRLATDNVGCNEWDPTSNVTQAELCYYTCQPDSQAEDYQVINHL